jgi:uncharacterized iron-regulated protein
MDLVVRKSITRARYGSREVGVALLLAMLPLVLSCAGVPPLDRLRGRPPDGPLKGQIWDVRAEAPIEWPALWAALSGPRFVLLGEKHDNAEHHRLQARIVEALARTGGAGAVALEMLPVDVAPELEAALSREGVNAEEVRAAVSWERHWASWEIYAPVVEAALDGGLGLVAANLPHGTRHRLGREGADALSPEERTTLGLDLPFPESSVQAMTEQIRAAHCGYAPEARIPRMIEVQRARDAQMARALIAASAETGQRSVILITGGQHARRDRGVPFYLERWLPDAPPVSLAFLEADPERADVREDLAERFSSGIPFDYLWYTSSSTTEDPCEKFRKSLEKLEKSDDAEE